MGYYDILYGKGNATFRGVRSCTALTTHEHRADTALTRRWHRASTVALPDERGRQRDRRELTESEVHIPGTRVISYFRGSSIAATIATIFCTSFLDKGSPR
ncbi:hypothetical protein RR46_02385 [Papilio xuthus]|uniref:Uncharacterized protein n=1 Tax=Papilio xuthus TaxID=66420 RepID=A0A194Q1G8_PAPXU|nr:hypothetical protein RR46_02385 [Papilio xuthus]